MEATAQDPDVMPYWFHTTDGPLQLNWKAAVHPLEPQDGDDPGGLAMVAWELRRALLDFSVEKRCNKWLKDNRSTWEELFELAGGSWTDSVWPSITAFRATNPRKGIPCHSRDEYQITTRALLAMLFRRAACGRNPQSRDKAMKILEPVLGALNWPPPDFPKNPGLVPRAPGS